MCTIDDVKKTVSTISKDIFYSTTFETIEDLDTNDFIDLILYNTNKHLSKYLLKKDIYKWLPFCSLTYDIYTELNGLECIEIYYYHDYTLHDTMYGLIEEQGMLMHPNQCIIDKLDEFYGSYNLDSNSFQTIGKKIEKTNEQI